MEKRVWGYDYGWNDDTNIVSRVTLVWTVQTVLDSKDQMTFKVLRENDGSS